MTKTPRQLAYAQRLVEILSCEALCAIDDPVEYARECLRRAGQHDLALHTVIKSGMCPHSIDDRRNGLTSIQRDAALQLCQCYEYLTVRSGYATSSFSTEVRSTVIDDGESHYMLKLQSDYSRLFRELAGLRVDRTVLLMCVIEGLPGSVIDKAKRMRNGGAMRQVRTALDRFAEIRGLTETRRHRYIGEMRRAA